MAMSEEEQISWLLKLIKAKGIIKAPESKLALISQQAPSNHIHKDANMASKTSTQCLATQDRIDELAYQAIGILQVMRRADTNDVLPTDALPGACWAVEGMVREIQQLAGESQVQPA